MQVAEGMDEFAWFEAGAVLAVRMTLGWKTSFIGFTGTPIESGDKNTQAVLGDLGGVPNTCEFDSL